MSTTSKRKIMVCQPFLGGEDHQARDNRQEFLVKSARWCDENGFEMLIGNMGRYVIQNVREDMCDAALKNECEYILFIDDDMIVPLDTLPRLMGHMGECDLVSPLTFQRTPPFFPVMYKMTEGDGKDGQVPVVQTKLTEWEGEIFQVDALGFGCVLMKTELLLRVPRPWFASWTTIGEDIWFSWNASKAGAKVCVDTTFWIGHLADRPIIGKPQFEEYKTQGKVTFWETPKDVLEVILEQSKDNLGGKKSAA